LVVNDLEEGRAVEVDGRIERTVPLGQTMLVELLVFVVFLEPPRLEDDPGEAEEYDQVDSAYAAVASRSSQGRHDLTRQLPS
jgi:hypothetical protein